MAGRGHIPPAYGGRSTQAPGMMRHGSFPAGQRMEPLPPPELADNNLVAQAAEIERLADDNHRLAATHVALRQDLVDTRQEIQRLRAHIGSIQTESDIQVRVLLDKIAKMDVDIRAGESVRKNLQAAHIEARSLVTARNELDAQIRQATQELDKARADVKTLPEMHAELDSLRKEHQRLRTTFEYEKGLNMEKVEQMQAMEKDLVGMAREVEKLRAEVLNAEKRAHVPNSYGEHYMHPDSSLYPPPPMHMSGGYVDNYGRPNIPMGVGATGIGNPGAGGGNPGWGGAYDGSHMRR